MGAIAKLWGRWGAAKVGSCPCASKRGDVTWKVRTYPMGAITRRNAMSSAAVDVDTTTIRSPFEMTDCSSVCSTASLPVGTLQHRIKHAHESQQSQRQHFEAILHSRPEFILTVKSTCREQPMTQGCDGKAFQRGKRK